MCVWEKTNKNVALGHDQCGGGPKCFGERPQAAHITVLQPTNSPWLLPALQCCALNQWVAEGKQALPHLSLSVALFFKGPSRHRRRGRFPLKSGSDNHKIKTGNENPKGMQTPGE